jgi:thiamine kinase-like enzyme
MIETWMQKYFDWPCTLTHGDFRLDNMFFHDDGTMTLIDWQLSMRSPSTSDLVYFLGTNMTTEMRRSMQEELIQRYCDKMRAGGVPDQWADYDTIMQGYAEGVLFYCTSFAASILSLDTANERGAALMDSLVRRAFSAADDLDAGGRLSI